MSLSKIIHSKLFSNLSNQFILYGFSHLVPLLLIPFLLNTIGVEKYGLVNFAIAFTFYFQVVNEFGFDLSNVRHVIKNRESSEGLGNVLSSILQCKTLLITITSIVFFSIVYWYEDFREYWLLYLLSFIRLYGIIISPTWMFRSMEGLKYVTRIVLPIKTICMLPVFLVIKRPEDYIWVMFFYALESLSSGLTALYLCIKKYNLRLHIVSMKDTIFYIKDSFPFFISTFMTRIYQTSNTVVLGFCVGEYAVGIYSTAEKLHNAYASFLYPVISHVLYPYFSRIKDFVRINKMVLIISLGNMLILLALYLISPQIFPMFIKEDVDTILSYFNLFLIILAISVPNEILGFTYLGVMGLVNKVNISTIIVSSLYLVGVITLCLCNFISISLLIYLLIIINGLCLLLRIYYIKQGKHDFLLFQSQN